MPSSASMEQCIFIGGRPSSASATALLDTSHASSRVLPLTSSVAILLEAIAAPQPKVLNFASVMVLFSIFKNIFIISPQTGFPTSPTPSAFSISPTFRGFLKWSMTLSLYIAATFLFAFLVQRRHSPEAGHNVRQYIENEIHILLGVYIPEGKPQRPMGYFHGKTCCQEDMGRFQRSGCTCTACRCTDPFIIKPQEHGFPFNELKTDINIPW